MNIENIKDIVDCMYSDFDWYGKLKASDLKRFKKYYEELKKEMEGK